MPIPALSKEADAPHTQRRPSPSESEVTKRRSLLPQPGQPRQSSHQRIPTTTRLDSNNAQRTGPGRLRPRSMYQIADAQSSQSRDEPAIANTRSTRPLNSTSKLAEPQITSLSRSKSLRKPALTQPVQSTTNVAHSRTQSTSSVAGTQSEITNTKPFAERPKSLLVAPGTRLRLHGGSSNSTSELPRVSARLQGMSRTAGVKERSETSASTMSSRPVLRPDDPAGSQLRRREILKEDAPRTAKPAFTTLQQHFTPRKSGKAPTSVFLQPAPASGTASLQPDVISLQLELLQLHLLHVSSAETSQQWHSSATHSLHQKFDEVATLQQAMLKYEHADQEQKNIQALLAWSADTPSLGLTQCIQTLSGPLHELPSLVEPMGRYHRLVGEFESWMMSIENIWAARRRSTTSNMDHETIEGLGDSWKNESAALTRRVVSFARDLDQLRQPSSGTSIASILGSCTALLMGMSDELHIMQTIEDGVVSQEKAWVEDRLHAIARDPGNHSTDVEMAAWRT